MARAGAKGATGTQLDAVLGGTGMAQTGNLTAIDKAVAAAVATGRPPAGADPKTTDTRPVTVDVANTVWLSPALPVRRSYLDALATGFGVGMYQIDYAGGPEAARKTINGWVGDHTHELIPELLGPGTITQDTVMTLVNAMYLSAPWQNDFYRTSAPLTFSTAPAKNVTAPAMSVTAVLGSAAGPGWTSVTIPYRGSGLAMTVVLPDADSFAAVRAELPTILPLASAAKPVGAVSLTMPLFKAEVHLSLVPAMKALGVKNLFTPSADLSGIAGTPGDIMASELIHQAVITVDDKGTEAAAATAMTAVASSGTGGDVKQITVNRPFFYSIHDTTTGAPLFLGQVTDPTR
jgi:serpin B